MSTRSNSCVSVTVRVLCTLLSAIFISSAANAADVLAAPARSGTEIKSSMPGQLATVTAPAGAPNVGIILLDDVGFGATGTMGGLIPTPTLDRLAHQGLTYNRFHTTGICSPTRAALLTGRNHHSVGMGALADMPSAYEGYTTAIPDSAATVAEVLREHGYATSAWGKWHQTPIWERSPSGPFTHWPTGAGFEKFYGVNSGESNEYEPRLYDGHTLIQRSDRSDYHLTEDITEHAIAWIQEQKSSAPHKPLFVYFAPAATHAPLQVPAQWIQPFRGKFDQGWDRTREEIFERQKSLGVIPANTQLTPRPAAIPAWDTLSPDLQKFTAETMEVYAGYMAHTDAQVGKLVSALEQMGEFDNTLFIYVVGDNGASAEAGVWGTANSVQSYNGVEQDPAQLAKSKVVQGGPDTHPAYAAGWAWAMDTPFQWTKQIASYFGGTRNPMIVTWPVRIKQGGQIRSQFHHVIDIAPTVYEAAGIAPPVMVNGVAQQPIEGVSMLYSFNDKNAADRRTLQYFELYGNRAVYRDGWMASAFHRRLPWQVFTPPNLAFEDDRWELFHVDDDFSQAVNLADKYPERLRDLQAQFWIEAGKYHIAPLDDRFVNRPRAVPEGTALAANTYTYFGPVSLDTSSAPQFINRSYQIKIDIDVPLSGAQGVLLATGGAEGGFALYLNGEGRLEYLYNNLRREFTKITADKKLEPGRHTVKLDFNYDGNGMAKGADVVLSADGNPAGKARLGSTVKFIFSVTEAFDVGNDSQSPVGDYPRNYVFTGKITRATVVMK